MTCRPLSIVAVAAATATACLPADARNEAFERPVREALAKAHARELVGQTVLRFGSASADGADIVARDVLAEGVATATEGKEHAPQRPTDEQVCQHAFEDAVGQLVEAARKAGAPAVVGIVSDFKGQVVDDAQHYDCHAGTFKSYVTLRGQLARAAAPAVTLPPASGFAALDDVQAVPIRAEGKERYAHFLTLPSPRAFVVYEDGGWRFFSKDPESATKALDYCARQGKRCWLYAVDDRVVWSADVDKRIAASAQLAPAAPAAAQR